MISLLLSKYKAYAISSVIAAALVSGTILYYKLKIASLTIDYESKLDDREKTLLEIERQANAEIARLNEQANQANKSYMENLKNAQTQINRLNSDLASNKRVLTSKVKSCVSTTKNDNSGATVTETRAELDSEVARSLVGITARCDEITLQLNALIDAVR